MTALPTGWTLDEEAEEDKLQRTLPQGWQVDAETTPKERDEEKLRKEAGVFNVEEKTPEELKNMSVREKMDYAKDLERQREFLQSSQFTKGLLSGATFGLTENVEALKPIEFEESNPYSFIGVGGDIAGSLVSLTGLMKLFAGPAMKLASKSPVLQRQLSSLATMMGVGTTAKGLETLAKGEIPTAEDVLEHGLEWVALDAALQAAGFAGRFAKSLIGRSKGTGIAAKDLVNGVNRELAESGIDMSNPEAVSEKALEILNRPISEAEVANARRVELVKDIESREAQVAQEALKPEPVTPKQLKAKKITDEPINRLTSESVTLAEPYQPEGINFTTEAQALENDAIASQIELSGPRAASKEELGNTIREDIESQLEAAKAEYRPLYEQAEEAAHEVTHIPKNTAREAGNKLTEISRLKTKPTGYSSVITTLENVLEDAGFVIQRDKEGLIENIISAKDVPVEKTMELARRLNEIIDFEAVEPTIKNVLKKVVRAAKSDVRAGLAQRPDALAAFELAEGEHSRVASKFSKDSIRKIRGTDAGEKISKMAEAPSTMGNLREVLSPQQMAQVEREMLENLNNQSYENAQKQLKELERHLSAENKKLAREIVESKNPHNPAARKRATQDAILNDMSNSLTNGSRPEKTLNLWKTSKGQKLVKETFHNSPNWPKVKEYLEKQSFNDMVSSVLKDGKLDLKKFNSFMKDSATVNNIRMAGGDEAVTFFKNLESNVKQLERNARILERLPSKQQMQKGSKIDEDSHGKRILQRMARKDYPVNAKIKDWENWLKNSLGLNSQAAMTVFGVAKLGSAITFGIPKTVVSMIAYRMMNKWLTSPRMRKAFIEASKHQTNPIKFILAVEHMGDVMDDEGI